MQSFGKLVAFENGMRDGRPWYDHYNRNQFSKISETIPQSIRFNSKNEAENFCQSYLTVFVRVYTHFIKSDVNVTPEKILWMGDSINPRTGKKGYESEWTDEDFYQFFDITDEEKKIIEETMSKYVK